MFNNFSSILFLFTGISCIFWFFQRIYRIICNNNWYVLDFFQRLKNIGGQSNKICLLIISFLRNVYECLTSMFPILLLVCIIRSFIFEPFQIPSGSMMPTLLIGDFILVKKFVYGIKNPINQKTLINTGHPKRGDVVVFKYPKDLSLNYIKRVIGEPGDRVMYNLITKQLTIYPKGITSDISVTKPIAIVYNSIKSSDFIQQFYTSSNGTVCATFIKSISPDQKFSHSIRLIQSTESFNGSSHNILTMIPPGDINFLKTYDQQHLKYLMSEWIVPEGEYFMMGDNRDNSSDSRYWGCVPDHNIIGKATMIWMSLKKQENEWPNGIQFDRIGKEIR